MQTVMEKTGKIDPDSEFGKYLGFTSDLFEGWLWKREGEQAIIISFIGSKDPSKGNFSRLMKQINECGYEVKVPTPLGAMKAILEKNGFRKTVEPDAYVGAVEMWIQQPPLKERE